MLNILGHWGNEWEDTTSRPLGELRVKRLTILSAGEDVEQMEISYMACGNGKQCNHVGRQFSSFLKS